MAKVTVLRAFAYGGAQGTRESTVMLQIGQEADVLDDLLPGLIKEGFVKKAVAKIEKVAATPAAAPLLDSVDKPKTIPPQTPSRQTK